jgi:SAM-dependent methyltransferase
MAPTTKSRSMSERPTDTHDTDAAWKAWGERDPYFGVITDERFRRDRLTPQVLETFFRSGEAHVRHVMSTLRQHVQPGFKPRRVLDFGCGVGRLLPAFSALGAEVVGVDIAEAMLDEARRNCERLRTGPVQLVLSDDELSRVEGHFDLVHTAIVLQHIEPRRGLRLIERLVGLLAPGGTAALHLTYAKTVHAANYGAPPAPAPAPPPAEPPLWQRLLVQAKAVPVPPPGPSPVPGSGDPEMQMNPYPLNDVLFVVQQRGARRLHLEFSDHGGELGATLFFAVPGP